MKQIINCETNEILERELNSDELIQAEIDSKLVEKNKKEAEKLQSAKDLILERLGITGDEAALLLK